LSVVALASRFAREPKSFSLRFFIIVVPCGGLSGGLRNRPRAPGRRKGVASSAEIPPRTRQIESAGWWGIPAHNHYA
jgi:hypothetical protein